MDKPASHAELGLNLPPQRARQYSQPTDAWAGDDVLLDQVTQWDATESNLLLLFGPYGAGKTHALSSILQGLESAELRDFGTQHNGTNGFSSSLTAQTILVDNYDIVTGKAGPDGSEPDLLQLKTILKQNRVVLATRRHFDIQNDELFRQLITEARWPSLGIRMPQIIELVPWTVEELREFAGTANERDLALVVTEYFDRFGDSNPELRRPQALSMIASIITRQNTPSAPLKLSNVLSQYASVTLAADYDAEKSRIPSRVKESILTDLAYDIYSGDGRNQGRAHSPNSIPFARIGVRVSEAVQSANLYVGNAGRDRYEWTADFLRTNHMLERVSAARADAEAEYKFRQSAHYEFFLARAIFERIQSGDSLELDDESFLPESAQSLAFSIVKEMAAENLADRLVEIASRPSLSTLDRMIILYFLEDDQRFGETLAQAPQEFAEELEKFEAETMPLLIRKIAMYQRVILGKTSPFDYIHQLLADEDAEHRNAEARLHEATDSVAQQLLARLKNQSLKAALPITIYRLGQFGDGSALESLEVAENTAADKRLVDQIQSAIRAIKEREGRQQ